MSEISENKRRRDILADLRLEKFLDHTNATLLHFDRFLCREFVVRGLTRVAVGFGGWGVVRGEVTPGREVDCVGVRLRE